MTATMVTIVVHLRPHIKPFLALESHQGSLFSCLQKAPIFLWKKGQDNNTTLMKEFFFLDSYHQALESEWEKNSLALSSDKPCLIILCYKIDLF